ncbi:MFS transporter, YNFM family, putative membrane transport protein [Ectothiorhodosinus mongolicus]|uniref:MFS transporter, YNFM family, putative membrane transport protein n=1 Tax=Ectothiorhodosinus mongolicus TaxID=233100 RepID=A0A1R3W3G8_9GAMM|nr:MFS transporter [Ectothiorhodosinus mongolicus]ULX57401.1 MFS transporter [Ectothiorhodosinus mongolicus]SIT72007.1 MFS transporter, YNFM family, putative membrane transport protein [Ectothiorhodosinus mongolicus]
MPVRQLLIIQYCTVLVMAALYTPQPLQPVLAAHFGVGESQASLLIAVTMLPLAIAPIFYGFLLQRWSARRLLQVSLWILALAQVSVYFVQHFEVLLGIRFIQGLAIPAMLTGLMTYVGASAAEGQIARVMAIYIASTVMGGFLGRALSGIFAANWGWRWSFLIFGLASIIGALLLTRLRADPPVKFQKLGLEPIRAVLSHGRFLRLYIVVFLSFGAFASVLNFLPYRLVELDLGLSEAGIGLMYSGYLMGVLVSLVSLRVASGIGGTVNAMLLGLVILALAMLFFAQQPLWLLFTATFVLCAGMFLFHSLAPGLMNETDIGHRGVVNGLYVSFYYSGGTVGSFLPGFVYQGFGWYAYLWLLVALISIAGAMLWTIRRPRPAAAG